MSSLWRKWYKVDELQAEVRELKKELKEQKDSTPLSLTMALKVLKDENDLLKAKLEIPTKQAYESMDNREFLGKQENQI